MTDPQRSHYSLPCLSLRLALFVESPQCNAAPRYSDFSDHSLQSELVKALLTAGCSATSGCIQVIGSRSPESRVTDS